MKVGDREGGRRGYISMLGYISFRYDSVKEVHSLCECSYNIKLARIDSNYVVAMKIDTAALMNQN